MARPDSRSKTVRNPVTETVGATAGYQVNTPINKGRGHSADLAFALADALKGARPFAEQAEADIASKAQADYQTGAVDENDPSRIYQNKVSQLRSRANWVRDVAEFQTGLQGLDLDTITAEELNSNLDQMFSKKYAGIDKHDPQAAEELLPKLQEYREIVLQSVMERQAKAREDAVESDLTAIAEATMANYKAGDAFDYHGLHEQVRDVRPGAETNVAYFRMIKDMAIRNGDPDLIRNIPKQWADGTPSFVEIPSWNDKVLAAEASALSAQAAKQKAADDAADDKYAEYYNNLARSIDTLTRGGDLAGAMALLDSERERGVIEGDDLTTLRKNAEAIENIDDVESANEDYLAELNFSMHVGEVTEKDLFTAYRTGAFGNGKQATQRFASMMDKLRVIREQRASNPALSRKEVSVAAGNLKLKYKPDKILGQFDDARSDALRWGLEEFYKRVGKGEDPFTAQHAVEEELDKRLNPKTAVGLPQTMVARGQTADLVSAFATGQFTTTEIINAGVTTDVILTLHQNNKLSTEQARKALNRLKQLN